MLLLRDVMAPSGIRLVVEAGLTHEALLIIFRRFGLVAVDLLLEKRSMSNLNFNRKLNILVLTDQKSPSRLERSCVFQRERASGSGLIHRTDFMRSPCRS